MPLVRCRLRGGDACSSFGTRKPGNRGIRGTNEEDLKDEERKSILLDTHLWPVCC
jgi:hypothetical protein